MNSGGPVKRTVRVANPMGLHMRPAVAFAQIARAHSCRVTVRHGEKQADGRSSLDLILLVALPGAELVLETDGDDAEAVAQKLADLLADPGDGL